MLLKLTLAPPILLVGGFVLFVAAWSGDSVTVAGFGLVAMLCGVVGIIPGLVIAVHAALGWQTSGSPVRVVIGLALLSSAVAIAITVASTVLASTK